MAIGYNDSLATSKNKIPKAKRTTIADTYTAVLSLLLSIQVIIISGLTSKNIPASIISIPNNLMINFMIR